MGASRTISLLGGPGSTSVLPFGTFSATAAALTLILEVMGHQVRSTQSGREVARAVREFRPDVVLLDIGMPDLDGYETAKRIRSLPQGRAAVLIAQTGWGQDEDQRRAAEVGFDAHLTKPIEIAELARLLDKLQPASC